LVVGSRCSALYKRSSVQQPRRRPSKPGQSRGRSVSKSRRAGTVKVSNSNSIGATTNELISVRSLVLSLGLKLGVTNAKTRPVTVVAIKVGKSASEIGTALQRRRSMKRCELHLSRLLHLVMGSGRELVRLVLAVSTGGL
jgi:hypothetical protein